jgi:hypothetical protein
MCGWGDTRVVAARLAAMESPNLLSFWTLAEVCAKVNTTLSGRVMCVHSEQATFIPDAIDLSIHHPRDIHATTAFTPDDVDSLIHAEISLPRGPDSEADIGRVVQHLRDNDSTPIGTHHENPTLDSCLYEALFANTISANIKSSQNP